MINFFLLICMLVSELLNLTGIINASNSIEYINKGIIGNQTSRYLHVYCEYCKKTHLNDSYSKEESKKENECIGKILRETIKILVKLFELPVNSDNKHLKSSLENPYIYSGNDRNKTCVLFVRSEGPRISNTDQNLSERQNTFFCSTCAGYPQVNNSFSSQNYSDTDFSSRPINSFPLYEHDTISSKTNLLHCMLNKLYLEDFFTNLYDLLPFLENNYFFETITNSFTQKEHMKTLLNLAYNEINIMKVEIPEIELEQNWETFKIQYSSIKIIDYDSPLISYFPGIVHLKEFIYNLLESLPLRRRNIFNVFVGMKMIESLLVSSKEIISSINPFNTKDIFSPNSKIKKKLNEYKVTFYRILKIILCKNFKLPKEFYIKLRIVDIGCARLINNGLYPFDGYNSFLRILVDSIFLLDFESTNAVSAIFEKLVSDVNLKTGFVYHSLFDLSCLKKMEFDSKIALKFVRNYLKLLQQKEFICCKNLNGIFLQSLIDSLTLEANKIEKGLTKKASSETNEHIHLLFKCTMIFDCIIKLGFNRNIQYLYI
ncbi:hypothetical protein CWI39_0053p0010 [Hamiltosporidium magnivora]|uniref:Uncharacterized protein n=1 Tax=Hamiltosporidium magnivora TaxID=148818 RepID=A0A4Q9LMP3_9MICR|nr:hypothetical protein CWI39_0053p0010 [Hamiltosporidium magnivora]